MINEVFLIFKTHLDVGYTDYAKNVIDTYLNGFIPGAIKTGYELKDKDTPFIWSVGSWLIWEGLKRDKDKTLEKAIKDGVIAWHGLPFTTHTEAMNGKLFEYGLSLSKELDKRFGKKTIAAKMTDVPGHTMGMLPLMSKAGIKFLHIGINDATPLPPVPPLFRWRCDGEEVVVLYQQAYGLTEEFENFALCFAHTHDNLGTQSIQQIKDIYAELRKKYPQAEIKAATLNDVAERILALPDIPVLEKEIGDTWIHGIGTDPKKLGMYRELLRKIEDMDTSGFDFANNLLLLPEHTWGMCLKRYFPDAETWFNEDLKKLEGDERRIAFEKSWDEQREYVRKTEKLLDASVDYRLEEPDLDGYEAVSVVDPGFEVSWQIFDRADYQRYMDKYMQLTVENVGWCIWDFIKLGMPEYEGGIYTAVPYEAYKKGDSVLYKLKFEDDVTKEYGLPYIWAKVCAGKLELRWFDKEPSRIPQACWLKFKGFDESWEIEKLGKWIKPENILGSPLISGIGKGIRNKDVEITSLDAGLVAPYGRRLLDYDLQPEGEDMYFNLYNNIWNTNFPMWYSDDTKFRFEIKQLS